MDNAFEWLESHALDLESDYGYTGTGGTCKSSRYTG
jgi:hypothetical protein